MFMHGSINSFTIDSRIPLSTLLTIGYLCLVPFTLPGTIIAQHVTDITTTEALSNSLDSNGEYDPHHHINDMLVDCVQYFYLRPPPVLSQLLRSTDCIAQIPSFFFIYLFARVSLEVVFQGIPRLLRLLVRGGQVNLGTALHKYDCKSAPKYLRRCGRFACKDFSNIYKILWFFRYKYYMFHLKFIRFSVTRVKFLDLPILLNESSKQQTWNRAHHKFKILLIKPKSTGVLQLDQAPLNSTSLQHRQRRPGPIVYWF